MGRRLENGARGKHMVNASAGRSRAARFARTIDGSTDGTDEVPYYLVGLKRKGGKSHLNASRDVQKAHMALKAGVSGFGCVEGSYGTIIYPMTEQEKELLTAIGDLALENVAPAVPGGPIVALDGMPN